MERNHDSQWVFQSHHSLCFPTTGPTSDSFSWGSETTSLALLLVPLPSSHYPLQETRRPETSFYHPVLLKVALNQGAPAGGLPCNRVMLQAPCSRDGLAAAFLEHAPVGVTGTAVPWRVSSPAESCPAAPRPLPTQPLLLRRASSSPWQATSPRPCTRSPPGTPCPGFLQQSCAQTLLCKVHFPSGTLPSVVCFPLHNFTEISYFKTH